MVPTSIQRAWVIGLGLSCLGACSDVAPAAARIHTDTKNAAVDAGLSDGALIAAADVSALDAAPDATALDDSAPDGSALDDARDGLDDAQPVDAISSDLAAAADLQDGAAEVAGGGPPYPIVLCHGFFGFNDFAGADFLTYFYKVKQTLENQGELQVFTPSVDPFGSSDARSAQLYPQIQAILKQTAKAKVVLIGHSQGGLDARIIAHDHPDQVAAVVALATPHQGTPVADAVLFMTPGPISKGILDAMGKLLGGAMNPDGTTGQDSVMAALSQLSSKAMPPFNAAYPDVPGMPFWTIAGRSVLAGGGGDCDVANPPAFISKWSKYIDPCNVALLPMSAAMIGIKSDGLVPVTSAKRGTFLGCIPADHMDEVGQIFGQPPGIGNKFDHLEFWSGLVQFVRAQGL